MHRIALAPLLLAGCVRSTAAVPTTHPRPNTSHPATRLSPLEQRGRALYAREGCDDCHAERSQHQPTSSRYRVTRAPELSREGGKFPALWHYRHFEDPRSVSPDSMMPAFPSLLTRRIDAADGLRIDAETLAGEMARDGVPVPWDTEVIALIAYLQSLGRDLPPQRSSVAVDPTPVTDAEILALASRAKTEAAPIWKSTCAVCHGPSGTGGIGPNHTDGVWLHGGRPSQIHATIRDGVVTRGMPAWGAILGDEKIKLLAAYVVTVLAAHGTTPTN